MNKLRWLLFNIKVRIGWIGLLGLAGLFYAVVYYSIVIVPAQNSLAISHAALIEAKSEKQTKPVQMAIINKNPNQDLHNFISSFPNSESINATWERLSKLVESSGLKVDHYVYAPSPDKRAGLLLYQINIPFNATYLQLREFLGKVFQAIPNASLENINIKRVSVDNALLEINISLVVYVRAK